MGLTDVWTFVAAVVVFLAIPGPGTFALLTATAKGGKRGGYAALAGAGVAALLAANPVVFKGVQYLGAAYLVWVGITLLSAKEGAGTGLIPMQAGHWFRQGLLITLLNPKAIVFYMAFFPLFIDPAQHQGFATFATMAVLIALITLIWCSGLILIGDALAGRMKRQPRLARGLQKAAGVCLIGFGIKLGTQ
jgi:threonine/homoserine/homoserine lactone efflux protein